MHNILDKLSFLSWQQRKINLTVILYGEYQILLWIQYILSLNLQLIISYLREHSICRDYNEYHGAYSHISAPKMNGTRSIIKVLGHQEKCQPLKMHIALQNHVSVLLTLWNFCMWSLMYWYFHPEQYTSLKISWSTRGTAAWPSKC